MTTSKKETKKRGKKLWSGKAAKVTSQVVNPQIWPHSELSLSYISKEVSYNNLDLAEFATQHSAFPWPAVRSLHAAALFKIECGRLCWGVSFVHLEA